MKPRYLWLLVLLITIGFFSFGKKEATIELYGKVLHKDRGLSSVEVAVVREDLDHRYPYYEPTTPEGEYQLKFNIHEGRPVQIVYRRKGYSILKLEKSFSGQKLRIPMQDVELIRLPGTKDNYGLSPLKTAGHRYLDVFPNKNTEEMPSSFHPDDILFFNFIDKQECSEFHGAYWYYVNFRVNGRNETMKGYVLQ
jgi:hypothetical protein